MQVPNLGVCERDYRSTVFADVPGLLEGAHEGLGLGHEFLRHVSRCRCVQLTPRFPSVGCASRVTGASCACVVLLQGAGARD